MTWLALPPVAQAVVETTQYVARDASITISGPADAMAYGTNIGFSQATELRVCGSTVTGVYWDLAKITMTSVIPWTGRTYRPSAAFNMQYLYESGVSGFAIVPAYRAYYFNGEIAGGVGSNYVNPGTKVAWTGKIADATRRSTGFTGVNAGYSLYKDVGRFSDSQTIPGGVLYKYDCYDTKGVLQETNYIVMKPLTVIGSVTSCTPDTKATTVTMDNFPITVLANAANDTLIGTKSRTFSLKCDPNISLFFSIVDMSDQTNLTTTAKLTPDSTATGVGFAVTSTGGTRLKFGPDGSAAGILNQSSYYLANSGTNGGIMSHTLNFSYVRQPSEVIKAGTAKAIVGIAYSYR